MDIGTSFKTHFKTKFKLSHRERENVAQAHPVTRTEDMLHVTTQDLHMLPHTHLTELLSSPLHVIGIQYSTYQTT